MSIEERRRVLVEAALRVIVRDGVAAATTRAISAEAGTALAGFHYAFPSREALMAACFEAITEAEDTMFRSLDELADIDLHSTEAVIAVPLMAHIEMVVRHEDLQVAFRELTAYCVRVPELRPAVLAYRQQLYARVVESIELLAALTGTVTNVPTGELAAMVIAVAQGISSIYMENRDEDQARASVRLAARMFATLQSPVDAPGAVQAGAPAEVPTPAGAHVPASTHLPTSAHVPASTHA